MRGLLLLGGLCLAAGVALGLPALTNYAGERGAWRDVSANVEIGGYDAALSDSLYQASEETRRDAEWAGLSVTIGWLFLLAGWTPRDEGAVPERRWRITLIDGVLAWGLLLAAGWGESLGWWDTRESAAAAALSNAALALFFVPYAPLFAGRSLGLTLTGGALPRSRALRLRALLLAPCSLPVFLLTFWMSGRLSWLKALHLPREAIRDAADTAD
ncbi:MAG: hypothetical protein AB8H86_25515 [Polyangiales bacterium]